MSIFTSLPLIGQFIKSIDKDLDHHTFQSAMRNVVKRTNSKFIVKGKDKEIEQILKNRPVVLVANHPYEAEVPAVVASLPDREEISLIANRRLLNLSSNLDKYLIPVYIDHHDIKKKRHKVMSYFLRAFHSKKRYTALKEHQLNIQSISIAAKKVEEGGLVIIFPNRKSNSGDWFTGVGHMLTQIERKDIYIMRAFIEGTSILDLLRLFPIVGNFLPTITLTFAPPLKLEEIWDNNPKKITAILENKFNNWAQTLNNTSPSFAYNLIMLVLKAFKVNSY